MSPIIGRPWTEAEDAVLRDQYLASGSTGVGLLIGRSQHSIRARAARLKIIARRGWTDVETRRLRNLWGEKSVQAIGEAVGRPASAVFRKAMRLGLPAGIGPGMESIWAASRRTGYDIPSLRRILNWAGVTFSFAMSDPASTPKPRRRCIDRFDVDQAVKAWLAAETVEAAARARGMSHHRLLAALKNAAGVPPKPGRKKHWRISSDVIDRALDEYRRAS